MNVTDTHKAQSLVIRVLLTVVLLCTGTLLNACNVGRQQPAANIDPVNRSQLELPEWDTYSWMRDVGFSQLDPDEQLGLINTARFQQESSRSDFWIVEAATDGSIYAVGRTSTSYGNGDPVSQGLIVKYDNNLRQIGVTYIDCSISAVTTDRNGFVYAACTAVDESGGVLIVKYDAELNEIARCFMPEVNFYSAGITAKGCLLLCGYGYAGNRSDGTYGLIVKYSSDLEFLDSVTWSNKRFDSFYKLVTGSDDSVYVAGWTGMFSGSGQSAVLLKFDSSLDLQKTVIKTERDHNNEFTALAIGSDDSIFVAFNFNAGSGTYDFMNGIIIKYDSDLTETRSLYLPDIYQVFPEYLPSGIYPNFIRVISIAVDQNNCLYCIGYFGSFSMGNMAVALLDSNLSVLNSAVWKNDNGLLLEIYDATIADDGSVYIVGSEAPFMVGPLFTNQIFIPPEFSRAVIFK
jgi:hypothetical protein